jgi:hypothetical protein
MRVTARGIIDADVIKKAFMAIVSHPEFAPGLPAVWDFRAADMARLSLAEMHDVHRFVLRRATERGFARSAVLVSRDVDFGVGRMLEVVVSGGPVAFRVFRDTMAADSWLRGDAA